MSKTKTKWIEDAAVTPPKIGLFSAGATAEKATPVAADRVLIEDSAAGNAKKWAQVGNLSSNNLRQSVFSELATDTTTTSTVYVPVPLIANITTTTGGSLMIHVSSSMSASSNNRAKSFQLLVDGTPVRGCSVGAGSPSGAAEGGAIVYKTGVLTAAAHTIAIEWKTSGGTAQCRPATVIEEHFSLLVVETGA